MPEITTLGRHLVDKALPPDYRDNERVMTGDALESILISIGRDNPELYRDVTNKLVKLGANAAFTEGSTTTLDDVKPVIDMDEIAANVKKREAEIRAMDISDAEKEIAIEDLYVKMQKEVDSSTYKEGLRRNNSFAMQVLSKSRGNERQLASMLSGPMVFHDNKGNLLPIFVSRSYAKGLKPWEFFAAGYGARAGIISTKTAVPDAGDLGKQFSVAASHLLVSEDDCGTGTGVPFDVEDSDNDGAVLARKVGKYDAGTVVTPKIRAELSNQGYTRVLLRSPMTCNTKDGLCKVCVGQRENGRFPPLKTNIGLLAASPLAERIAQGSLNVKHGGRSAEAKGGVREPTGFKAINQLVQVPETFQFKAPVAELDGTVQSVDPAPQGGYIIKIEGQEHYVDPDREIYVKPGQRVEAGDQLAYGIMSPADVVAYKGIGEGRRYLADKLTKTYRDSKLTVNRRNAEVVARAVIDQVDVDDPSGLGDYLPGDTVSYSALAATYAPRPDAATVKPEVAVGKYLEAPVLHYTVGTKVSKRMAQELGDFDVNGVLVHDKAPGFIPVMERLRSTPGAVGKDWVAKLKGSNLKANLLKDLHFGAESPIHSVHPEHGLAYAAEFGRSKPGKITY